MSNLFLAPSWRSVLNFGKFSKIARNWRPYCKKTDKQKCQEPGRSLFEMDCKTALITGGSEGMGFSIAHQILCNNGKKVALIGTDTCVGREAVNILNCTYGNGRAIFLKTDVKCPVQLNECFKEVNRELGRIDIVVNSAGICHGADWEVEIHTNFIGTIRSTLLAYQYMSKECSSGAGGVILNIAGTHGLGPLGSAPTLAAGYHGIVGFTRSFGDECNSRRTGVRILCLCPGMTHTNFIKNIDQKAMTEPMGKDLAQELRKTKMQKAEVCGKAGLHLMRFGESGSVWVVEGSNLYRLNMKDWREFSQLVAQFI